MEMTRDLLEDLLNVVDEHLRISKGMLDKKTPATMVEKDAYNQSLQTLVTAEGSLLVHLGMERKVTAGKFQI